MPEGSLFFKSPWFEVYATGTLAICVMATLVLVLLVMLIVRSWLR